MEFDARLNASGMAHLLARLSGRIRDTDDLECIERALLDYCELNNCTLVRCSGQGFDIRLPFHLSRS